MQTTTNTTRPGTRLRVALSGATGRVGRRVAALLRDDPELVLAAALASPERPDLGADLGAVLGTAPFGVPLENSTERAFDVLIDLSVPSASAEQALRCAELGRPIVIGTTGQSREELESIEEAARTIAVVLAPNLSPGVAVLRELAAIARRRLGADFDVEILEYHRRGKRDAPSGTALALARALEADPPGDQPPSIPIHSVRAGDIAGEHALLFAGPGETLLLRHRALDRDLFARGARRAARWLIGRAPGLYTMSDVLASPDAR